MKTADKCSFSQKNCKTLKIKVSKKLESLSYLTTCTNFRFY